MCVNSAENITVSIDIIYYICVYIYMGVYIYKNSSFGIRRLKNKIKKKTVKETRKRKLREKEKKCENDESRRKIDGQ